MIKRIVFISFFICLFQTISMAQGDLTSIMRSDSAIPESPTASRFFDLTGEPIIKTIGDDYLLGSGDILTINLGNITADEVQQQVSSQGDVMLPTVGKVKIAGMTVAEAEKTLNDACAKFFRNYDVRVQVNQVRKVEVYLVGQVHQPGVYLCYSGTTLSQFMQLTGRLVFNDPSIAGYGERQFYTRTNPLFTQILPEGSVRRAELRRDKGETIQIDLTEIMIYGNKSKDIALEHGDVIFIPPMEKSIIVKGGVNPGRYEIMEGDTLARVLEMAGGSGAMNLSSSVAVEEINELTRSTRTVDVKTMTYSDDKSPFKLSEDTIVRLPQHQEYVYIIGAVPYPGMQDFVEGDTLMDYLGRAGGFTRGEQMSFTNILRRKGVGIEREIIRVDLKDVFKTKDIGDLMVYPGDIIFVPPKNQPLSGRDVINVILGLGSIYATLQGN